MPSPVCISTRFPCFLVDVNEEEHQQDYAVLAGRHTLAKWLHNLKLFLPTPPDAVLQNKAANISGRRNGMIPKQGIRTVVLFLRWLLLFCPICSQIPEEPSHFSLHPFIQLSVCSETRTSMHLSVHLSISVSICLAVYPWIHEFIFLSVHPYI